MVFRARDLSRPDFAGVSPRLPSALTKSRGTVAIRSSTGIERTSRGRRARIGLQVIALVFLLGGCSDSRPYEAALDGLAVPPTWEAVKTVIAPSTDFCMTCAQVSRYYLAEGELPNVFAQAEQAIRAAGYSDVHPSDPNCDRNSNAALCSISARSETVLLIAALYRPGDDVDRLGLARADRPLIRITAKRR
jgi:hypothetical protein